MVNVNLLSNLLGSELFPIYLHQKLYKNDNVVSFGVLRENSFDPDF